MSGKHVIWGTDVNFSQILDPIPAQTYSFWFRRGYCDDICGRTAAKLGYSASLATKTPAELIIDVLW